MSPPRTPAFLFVVMFMGALAFSAVASLGEAYVNSRAANAAANNENDAGQQQLLADQAGDNQALADSRAKRSRDLARTISSIRASAASRGVSADDGSVAAMQYGAALDAEIDSDTEFNQYRTAATSRSISSRNLTRSTSAAARNAAVGSYAGAASNVAGQLIRWNSLE